MRKSLYAAFMALLAGPVVAQTVLTQTYTLTVAQMTACNTSPIELLPAVPGTGYLPVRALGTRTSAAYATQPGEIQIKYGAPVPGVHLRLDTQTGALLTQRRAWLAFGPTTGRYGADDAISVDMGGKAIFLFCSVANPTVDLVNVGSDINLTLVYESWATPNP